MTVKLFYTHLYMTRPHQRLHIILYIGFTMRVRLLFMFLLFPLIFSAQEITIPVRFITNIKTVPDRYEGKDTFDWLYTITNNTLRKEKDGRFAEYKNVALGDIYKVDIQNPLQVVVFYRRFNTAVLLDNQLNETARINFSNITTPVIAEAVNLASQNRLWVYDINTQKLGLYTLAQNEFKAITPPFTDTIRHYQSDYNYFYWIDSKGQCYASNLFGKVSYLGNVPEFEKAQILSQQLVLLKTGNTLYQYNMKTGSSTRIEIVENSFTGFQYAAQILSIFTEREINQYKVTLPE